MGIFALMPMMKAKMALGTKLFSLHKAKCEVIRPSLMQLPQQLEGGILKPQVSSGTHGRTVSFSSNFPLKQVATNIRPNKLNS